MIRKLAFALSLLGASFTGFVHALGLGEAEVKSSLNQPLKAEINLVNVGGLTQEEILPGLATREEFLRAGVDRVYFLSDMKFTVDKNSSGDPIVVLTTNKPVREPFLNFLVEVIWPSGRLLREYALFIDPPVFTKEKAQPVQAPARTATKVEQVKGDVVSLPSNQSATKPQASQIQVGGEYGPTSSKDTLWDIALKARPDRSVSPQQVMLAIQDLNPSAFIKNNINKMKAGQVLRLPTLDQIKQRSSYEAINEVIAQNEALRPAKRKAMVSSSRVDIPPQARATSSAGDELKLVVADQAASPVDSANSGDSETGGTSKASSEELALTLEKLDKANSDNAELTGRLGDLEDQLETLQRLLTLKNDQLANLQAQMQANDLAQLQVEGEGAQQLQSEGAGDEAGASDQVAQDSSMDESGSAESGQDASNQTDVEETGTEKAGTEQAVEKTVADKPAEEVSKPKIVDTQNIGDSKTFIENILSNPLYMGIGGIAIIVLLILLWFVSRSNAQREQEFQESADDFDTADFSETSGESESVEEDGLADFEPEEGSEFAQETSQDDEMIPSDEKEDAIAEADVYIAYGRLDQAAGILEEAISSDPVRTDYRLKLLEVYKESNDVEAFNRQFGELEAIQDDEAIEQANQIRGEMLDSDLVSLEDMENDLLNDEQGGLSVSDDLINEESVAIEDQPEALEPVADLDEAVAGEELAADEQDDVSNTFDFDAIEEDSTTDVLADDDLDIDLSSDELDVDLDIDLDADKSKEQGDADTIDFAETEVDSSSDDNLVGDGLLDGDALDTELSDAVLDDSGLDVALDDVELSDELNHEKEIDLPSDLSLSDELEAQASEEAADDEAVVSDDILDEAVDALGDPDEFDADLGEGDDFDFLEGTDEASTKLDLARAYIDMGDLDGARDILEEVKAEGSDEQKAEAQDLLGSIDD